jgi:hypothetical protein
LGEEISQIEKRIEDFADTRLEHESEDERLPPTMEKLKMTTND